MRDPRESLYAVACAAMFVFGVILGLPGTALAQPDVVAALGLTLADRGAIISALFLGMLGGCVLSGPVVDALGGRATLAWSIGLVALCLPLFTLSSSFAVAAVAMAALGVASAGTNTAANALSSDLFPEERGRRMNGIALSVGLGGLLLPAATALGAAVLSWRGVVFAAAVLAFVVAVAATRIRLPVVIPAAGGRLAAMRDIARQPRFAWFALLLMAAAANESSSAGWISTYLISSGFAATTATWLLASHWLGLCVARLVFAGRVDRGKRHAVIRAALVSAVVFAVLVTARSPLVLALLPFVLGMAIAVIMPTALAIAGEQCRGNQGLLIGMLLTLGQVGSMSMPALIGGIAEAAGIRWGLSVLIVNAGVIAIAAQRAARIPASRGGS